MNLLNAIYSRISRRSYLNKPIEEEKIQTIRTQIDKYNKESHLTIQLIEDGSDAFNGLRKSYGMFTNVRTIVLLKGKIADKDLKEKCGFFGEYLVLEATEMGLGSCWVGATFDKSSDLLKIPSEEELVCILTLGYTAEQTSLKENFLRKMAHGKVKPLEHFYTSDATPPPAWFLEAIQAVQIAPSARNRQQYLFEYKNDTVAATSYDSYAFGLVDLGIAKAHFVLAAGGTFPWGNPAVYSK